MTLFQEILGPAVLRTAPEVPVSRKSKFMFRRRGAGGDSGVYC
jgi:hypothetical protein